MVKCVDHFFIGLYIMKDWSNIVYTNLEETVSYVEHYSSDYIIFQTEKYKLIITVKTNFPMILY